MASVTGFVGKYLSVFKGSGQPQLNLAWYLAVSGRYPVMCILIKAPFLSEILLRFPNHRIAN